VIAKADVWPLSQGNVVADLTRWKGLYIESLRGKSYAERTRTIYSEAIEELVEYSRQFQDEIAISDIGAFFIVKFLDDKDSRSRKGLSDSTKGHYMRIFKTFFKYIEENNIESFSMLYNLRNLKIKRDDPANNKKPAYTSDQVEQIKVTIENIRKKTEKQHSRLFTATRNFILMKMALYAGLRAIELSRVRYEDLEPFTGTDSDIPLYRIDIWGKGDTQQYAYIRREEIDEELETLRKMNRESGLIAISTNGKPLGPVQINHNISRITKQAGMSKQGVHIFRHTYARTLLREGHDTEIVKQLLRHNKIQTTVDFYLVTDEDAKAKAAATVGTGKKRGE